MLLVVDCCIRGDDSATRKYYQAYLQARGATDVVKVELAQLPLRPLDQAMLHKRDLLCAQGDFGHEMFHLAWQFKQAEEILLAAPFWDLSFPALLKVYLEWVCVNGVTFGYTADGRCQGYCRARQLHYFSTCGGFCGGRNLGFEYVQALAAMLGIEQSIPYIAEGLDIDPSRREAVLDKAISSLPRLIGKKDGGR